MQVVWGDAALQGVDGFAESARQDVDERLPEIPVEDTVDDGVEHGVGVAKPQRQRVQPTWNMNRHEGRSQGKYEEREPADQEGDKHDAHGQRRLPLLPGVRANT